jgi:hypothetical protein
MNPPASSSVPPRWIGVLIFLAAAVAAFLSARPYAGSWNDSSRLATVECLVDYHTLAIDQSIFANGFRPSASDAVPPFPPDDAGLLDHGTLDKLYINGHYYTDKPQVQAVLMAAVYQVWEWLGGEPARVRPDHFCWLMTFTSSGLSYALAVWCMYHLGLRLGLPPLWSLLLMGSFALATVAPAYCRQVNAHITLLAIVAGLFLVLLRLAAEAQAGPPCWTTLAWLGTLGGLGYTTDLGVGPLLVLTLVPVVLMRTRHPGRLAIFALAMLPWLLLHHGLNYAIGGTFRPANSVPEYFAWPGSPFDAKNLTGSWHHNPPGHFFVYAAELLFGKRGFMGHNLAPFLLILALPAVLRLRTGLWREALFAVGWSGGTWLLYAALSSNYSGPCCSIRWFVPLLVPAYFLLALLLKAFPEYRLDFLVLSGWGVVLGALMWWKGPWMPHMVPAFWPIQAAALVTWVLVRRRQARARATLIMARS